ncbi:MAG: ankyrin repeat domain-containing protein [Limisphaerales bacterium]
MAPEFLPFIAFVVLSALAILALVLGVGLILWSRYQPNLVALLRSLSVLAFSGFLVVGLVLLFLGKHIHQQYFLNEPLVTACGAQGQLTEVQRLLDRGASPDSYGIDYTETALIAAARTGNQNVVALLLRKGADPKLTDSEGKTAVERAKETKHDEIASAIEQSRKLK